MINKGIREEKDILFSGNATETNMAGTSDPLWTVEDVAGYLKLQPETIRSMARRGELPAIKLGKVWRFEKTAILHMLVSR